MKRHIAVICATLIIATAAVPVVSVLALGASADDASEPSNVTITVVMPENTAEQNSPSAPEVPATPPVFPSDVTEIRENGEWHIIKTYELRDGERPQDIPRDSFERSGWTFTLTDIIRRETANAETREHTETVTLDTQSNDLESILPLLAQTMEHQDEDGFTGILTLDVSSIKVETAGTRTSTFTRTITREYPRLSSTDTANIPKTVVDRGTTYTLAGVDWRPGNTVTVDYFPLAEFYTAIATYTAQGTSTRVIGYRTTAEYTGTLARLSQGKTFFTAYFIGEPIRTPLEMLPPFGGRARADRTAKPGGENTSPPVSENGDIPSADTNASGFPVWLAIIPCAAIFTGGAYYFIRKRKESTNNEETDDITAGNGNTDGDGSTGTGNGLPL